MYLSRRQCLVGVALLAASGLAAPVDAQSIVHVDRPSPERKAILDVVRAPIERLLGVNVVFVVRRLAIFGDWAFADLAPRTEGGGRIDFRRTRFARDFHPDLDSDTVHALLRRTGTGWTLVEHAFLPTDVAWDGWRQQYRLPRSLFAD